MKKYFMITLAFLGAFIISNYSINNIFLAKSPKVNPYYLANLQNKIGRSVNSFTFSVSNIARIFNKKSQTTSNIANVSPNSIPENFFKSISKGVSAYEKGNDEVILKIEKGTIYRESIIQLPDGKQVIIRDYTGE